MERAHEICLDWARKHGVEFAPKKYELIHFTRKPRLFDMKQKIKIGEIEIGPKDCVRMLGAHLDPALKWKAHIAKIEEKLQSQIASLTRLTTSVYGCSYSKSRQLYKQVVLPAISYATQIWHSPKGFGMKERIKLDALEKLQNKCLRIITGGYKATAIEDLQREANIGPLRSTLDIRLMKHLERTEEVNAQKTINETCRIVANSIFQPGQAIATPRDQKTKWMKSLARTHAVREVKCWITSAAEEQWEKGWKKYKEKKRHQTVATEDTNWRRLFIIHKVLVRPQSSLATQLRTGVIGLRHFLHRMRVPGIGSPECPCGAPKQDVQHILECEHHEAGRERMFGQGGSRDLHTLLTTPEGAKALTRWWMQQGLQEQYSLAREMINEMEDEEAQNQQD